MDFSKKLKNFDRVWQRVQGAKAGEQKKPPAKQQRPSRPQNRNRGRRF